MVEVFLDKIKIPLQLSLQGKPQMEGVSTPLSGI
jgi:hypothetical protein